MREIKFRAWDGVKMFYPDSLMFNSIGIATSVFQHHNLPDGSDKIISNGGLTKDLRLMQFTGLKDKNGVEIYEGDIVKLTLETGLQDDTCKVMFGRGYFGVTADDFEYEPLFLHAGTCKVIGNIYENPELLDPTPQKGKDND